MTQSRCRLRCVMKGVMRSRVLDHRLQIISYAYRTQYTKTVVTSAGTNILRTYNRHDGEHPGVNLDISDVSASLWRHYHHGFTILSMHEIRDIDIFKHLHHRLYLVKKS